jgi:ubiquinone/menaquinone biosynthesis C-methylase UbiE
VFRDRYRLSFESVADVYERTRPTYAPDALAFVTQRLPLRRVLDLGAGTGKLTRQLVELGADVVAVEPGDAMRALLERVVPEAEALAGSAESIPLPDASVDVVTVAQAFHWFRPTEALAEMHRVLRPGGGFALFWNHWDDDDPVMHELNELVERLRRGGEAEGPEDWKATIADSPLFGKPEELTFHHAERLDADTIAGRIASVSVVASATPEEQQRVDAEVRALVTEPMIDFPMITSLIVADRV